MRTIKIIALSAVAAIMLVSCAPVSTYTKNISYMPVRFKPLTRADVTLIGNLQAEVRLSGPYSAKGGVVVKGLDPAYAANLKNGQVVSNAYTEVLYFAPGPGESMTGSLYESDIFNNAFANMNIQNPMQVNKKKSLFDAIQKKIMGMAAVDWSSKFAYYALTEKYPDVDYFINVRFDRKLVVKGKKYTETVTCYSDGLKLKTDN